MRSTRFLVWLFIGRDDLGCATRSRHGYCRGGMDLPKRLDMVPRLSNRYYDVDGSVAGSQDPG